MKLRQLLHCVHLLHGELDDPDAEISVISHRSDTSFSGGMFVALRGTHFDGNRFAGEAERNGARYLVTDTDAPHTSMCVLTVSDARAALARIWSNYYGNPADRMNMIAVTGTNGKTTTSYLLRAVLEEAGYRCGLIGTVNGAMTTPDPDELYRRLREFADSGVQYAVMEASSHALALRKLEPIRFRAGIFTNLTPEHLDFHGTMEAYRDAKAILFDQCETSYFNYDDFFGRQIYCRAKGSKYFYSAQSSAPPYHAANIRECGIDGVEYHLFCRDLLFRVKCPVPGEFTVYNTMAAAACAVGLGICPKTVRAAFSKMTGVPGRMERVATPDGAFSVFIDFAHTPDAMEKLLRSVRRAMKPRQRLVVLFGCGGDRDRSKRPVMGSVATRYADLTVITSDNSRSEDPMAIIRDICTGVEENAEYRVIPERRDAIFRVIEEAREGDVILLVGKGHETTEITAKGTFPFCERELVREALRHRAPAEGNQHTKDGNSS